MTGRHLFILGLGFSGSAYARSALAAFESVGGTVRSVEKAARLRAEGIETLVYDGVVSEEVRAAIARTTHLVQSIAPGEDGDPFLTVARDEVSRAPELGWIGYLSTVGVYGDHGGGWVDETTPCRPVSKRSLQRLDAEQAWTALAAQKAVPLAILRLAGIYGPGRNTFVNLAEGTARRLVKPGQVFNRIHVADIASALAACVDQGADGIFNITDDEPAPPQDVVAYASELAGYPPLPDIPFETADLSPMARSFYSENKRVSNRKLWQELGVKLAFPTYRDALLALWSSGWR